MTATELNGNLPFLLFCCCLVVPAVLLSFSAFLLATRCVESLLCVLFLPRKQIRNGAYIAAGNCLRVFVYLVKFSDMFDDVAKGILSIMLTPQKLMLVAVEEIFGCSCMGQISLNSPPCILKALCVSTCVWVYEV